MPARKPIATRTCGEIEIVVEGIFDEECDAKKQRKAADPSEAFHTHELFPVDCRRLELDAAARLRALAEPLTGVGVGATAGGSPGKIAGCGATVGGGGRTGGGVMIFGCGAGVARAGRGRFLFLFQPEHFLLPARTSGGNFLNAVAGADGARQSARRPGDRNADEQQDDKNGPGSINFAFQ